MKNGSTARQDGQKQQRATADEPPGADRMALCAGPLVRRAKTAGLVIPAVLLFWSPDLLARRTRRKRGYQASWSVRTAGIGGRDASRRRQGARKMPATDRFGKASRNMERKRRQISAAEAARRARVAARAVSRALARFDWEPSVREVQRKALAFARLHKPGITKSRIRGAAALPELRIGVDLGRLQTSTSRREVGSPVRLTDRMDADRTWTVEARWRLHRLIFDPNELKLQSAQLRRGELRDELLAHVTRLYFLRRRLQALEVLQPARTLRTALARRLSIQRLTGELDGLTGGWFSARLRKRESRK